MTVNIILKDSNTYFRTSTIFRENTPFWKKVYTPVQILGISLFDIIYTAVTYLCQKLYHKNEKKITRLNHNNNVSLFFGEHLCVKHLWFYPDAVVLFYNHYLNLEGKHIIICGVKREINQICKQCIIPVYLHINFNTFFAK